MDELGLHVDGRRGRGKGETEKNEQEDFVDPDSLSYIDKKIQDVLGHFQKEFHGGASSEALGPQFGGYGSFLPSYPRFLSILSHSKSPVKMPSHNVSRSPYNSHPKDGHHSPSVPGTTPITKVSISSTGNLTEMSDERKENINMQRAEGIIGEQKMLRFRINVGHNNDLDRSKPDIYSDLGLDMSTSSSVEDSPDGCGKCSPESPDAFLESPTTILQIMTCFSVPGGYLSPLPNNLLHSSGKDEILLMKGQTEAYASSSVTSLKVKFIRRKAEPTVKSQIPRKADGFPSAMVAILKESPRVITTDPHISPSSCARLGTTSEDRLKSSESQNKIFSDLNNASLRNDFTGNSTKENTHSNAKVSLKPICLINPLGERTGSSRETSNTKEKMGSKALRNSDTTMADSCSYSGWKSHTFAQKEPVNYNSTQKSSSSAEPCTKDLSPSSPVAFKRKMEVSGAPKLVKDDNKNNAIEARSGFRVIPHNQEVDDKKKHRLGSKFVDKSKEKLRLNKADNLHSTNLVALNCNSQTSDSLATISAPVINDSWVFCDLCQSWRLLPYGTNSENLPKEWQCSMQVWLPGLNKCYISEDETTKAFYELYQAPAPVNVTNFTVHPDTALSSISSSGTLNHNARLENKVHNAPSSGKRKHGSMKASNLPTAYDLKAKPSMSVVYHPDEGELFEKCGKQSTSKSKRQVNLDVHRSSKRIKKVSLHRYERDLHIEEEISSKMPINGDYDLPPKASKYIGTKPTSVKKPEDLILKNKKEQVSDFCSREHPKYVRASNSENPGKYDSKNKRSESKESQESGKNLIISQLIDDTRTMSKDRSSESQLRRQKKKVGKSEGHDFSATSSSSKMPGCQRSRVKLQEPRDSPVESVSSSLMRTLNTTNNSKNLLAKDGVLNIRLLKGSLKSSDGHVGGSSDLLGTMTKDTTSKSSLRISITLKTADPGVLLEQSNKGPTFDQKEWHDFGHKMSRKHSLQGRDGKKDCTSDALKKCKHKQMIPDSYTAFKKLNHSNPNKPDNIDNCSKQHIVHYSRVVTGVTHTEFISQESLHHASSHCRQDHSSQITVDRLEGDSENVTQTAPVSVKEINSEWCRVDAVSGDASKSAKQLRHSTPSAMKKDGHTVIYELIREARELKHAADHLKNEGLERDSSGILFEASLKFLHAASLMEPPDIESVRQGELFPSLQMLQMYLETAKLFEFCAHKYENLKEMAAAALAYKCAEVAYMKVAYFKQPCANKDLHDLQAALDSALLDESPSSSPFDVDNLNSRCTFEKAALGKGTTSPQISGDLVIAARNRHVKQLLAYTDYLNCSFEAARKSRNSIEAAGVELKDRIRKVLDCNFNNVEGLLQLVRISLNSIIS